MSELSSNRPLLTEKEKKRFFGNILTYLRTSNVESGQVQWDGDSSAMNRLLKLEESSLHDWVSRYSVLVEMYRRIQRKVTSEFACDDGADATGTKALADIVSNDLLEEVATDTVNFLSGIPYEYEYIAHLRGVKGIDLTDDIPISDMLTLTKAAGDGVENALVRTIVDLSYRRDFKLSPICAGDSLLRIRTTGYSSCQFSDSAPAAALSLVKEFVALSEAAGVFSVSIFVADDATTGLLKEVGDANESTWVSNIPLQVRKRVDKYCLAMGVTEYVGGLLSFAAGGTGRVKRSDAEVVSFLNEKLAPFQRIFASNADKHAIALRTAAHWYFDAVAEENETSAFIFVSLGFEALLGGAKNESELVGVKRLLGNRLAYLLGGSREVREKLIAEFDEFYSIRSAIVHGRERRLSYSSQGMLEKGKTWLMRALRKELSLI